MAKQVINIGTSSNDGTGSSLRVGGDMINDNFTELYDQVTVGKKEYVALLTQSDVAPVATVIKNTIGAAEWVYISTGVYELTLTAAFPEAKTIVLGSAYDGASIQSIYIKRTTEDAIRVQCFEDGSFVDGALSNTPIKIEVYP